MLINDVRSRNVYENKQKDDSLPDEKGDISTQWNDISHESTRILLKPPGFLSLFERWGTNSAPPRNSKERQSFSASGEAAGQPPVAEP
jgi:hypothetical protein